MAAIFMAGLLSTPPLEQNLQSPEKPWIDEEH